LIFTLATSLNHPVVLGGILHFLMCVSPFPVPLADAMLVSAVPLTDAVLLSAEPLADAVLVLAVLASAVLVSVEVASAVLESAVLVSVASFASAFLASLLLPADEAVPAVAQLKNDSNG
jgi:hypothetical protein